MNARNSAAAIAAVTLGLSGSALAMPGQMAITPQVQCDIEVVQTPDGTQLRPVARSGIDLSGSYQLTVETSGPAGSSSVSQGGEFALLAGQVQALGSVSLGRASGTRIVARVDVSGPSGRTRCVRRVTL
ncbi:curli-like amyloid fiber formation chaperone CsgH [Brevundimonas sp.]|uniref:curli-like amyloid fiber formation chaperone CsgH n=1 Tax=Brevundimonas sp. TaxID=1871086 RepID=UPI0026384DE4|nr:curli-like amyloid fiber formation chaperone CsgH [Brevundimonas sp.]